MADTAVAAPLSRTSTRSGRAGRRRSTLTAYLFLAPFLILFLVFVVTPAVWGVWISLHSWNPLLTFHRFIGLQNYTDLFTPGSVTFGDFWQSMGATGDLHDPQRAVPRDRPAVHRRAAQPADPRRRPLPRHLLRAVRARRRGHRRGLALPARPAERRGQQPARPRRHHPEHPVDRRRPMGLDLAGRHHRVVGRGLQHGDPARGPQGHQRRALRGRRHRRRRRDRASSGASPCPGCDP